MLCKGNKDLGRYALTCMKIVNLVKLAKLLELVKPVKLDVPYRKPQEKRSCRSYRDTPLEIMGHCVIGQCPMGIVSGKKRTFIMVWLIVRVNPIP